MIFKEDRVGGRAVLTLRSRDQNQDISSKILKAIMNIKDLDAQDDKSEILL